MVVKTSLEKAASVLLALGEDLAAQILAALPKDDALRLLHTLRSLGPLPAEDAKSALEDLAALLSNPPRALGIGQLDKQKFLAKAFGKHTQELLAEDPVILLKDAVRGAGAEHLARYLCSQSAQTGALILAAAEPQLASQLMRRLEEPLRSEMLLRLARLGPVAQEMVEELAEDLRVTMRSFKLNNRPAVGGPKQAAAILQELGKAPKDQLVELAKRSAETAKAIEESLFVFDDLRKIAPSDVQVLIKSIPPVTLRLALRGASDAVKEHLLTGLSQRAQALLAQDLAAMPKQPTAEVALAQKEVARVARQLAAEGRIRIKTPQDVYV